MDFMTSKENPHEILATPLRKTYRFPLIQIVLLDSSSGSNFEEVSVAIILYLLLVVFHGILPQMSSNLYKSFIRNAIKLRQKMNFWL